MIVNIVPVVQSYEWGDTTFIPSLIHQEADGRPKAELWFGTHPGGESTLPDGTPLGDFLRDHAETFLGKRQLEVQGNDLPFLLKVLAIARPLSLQVHPTTAQAQQGFADEVALHVDLPRDQWNYKDERQKAEVLYALTPVTAMCGFLPKIELLESLNQVIPEQVERLFPFLLTDGGDTESEIIEQFFKTLYTLEREELLALLGEYREGLKKLKVGNETEDGRWLTPAGIARYCVEHYPEDPGVLAPFFLHVLHMSPGDAVYLEPRTLHAYVRGNGVELMTNSDNVLRAGLTKKLVNVPELLQTLCFRPYSGDFCPQVRDEAKRITILAPTDDFLLGVYETGVFSVTKRDTIELLFCTEGEATLTYEGRSYVVQSGSCLVVAAAVAEFHLAVDGTLFSATVPG